MCKMIYMMIYSEHLKPKHTFRGEEMTPQFFNSINIILASISKKNLKK